MLSVFEVDGLLDELEIAIKFAMEMNGVPERVSYQITEDGRYCIGRASSKDENGWNPLPFDFDAHIVAEIVKQHIKKQKIENPHAYSDGSSYLGFLMKAISYDMAGTMYGIKNPCCGLISIEPKYMYYGK